jgi:Ca2+-binding RTX toxin-like protein
MKKIALVTAALLVSALFTSTPATAAGATSLASVFPHEVVPSPEGNYIIYFIEEDVLIEVPSSVDALDATAVEQLDELIAVAETGSMTCDGVKTTQDGNANDNDMNGSSGTDVMQGYAGNDTMDGNGGIDRMCGGRHNDMVRGGAGEDRVLGGPGHDEVRGGSGIDQILGMSGNDDAYDGHGSDDINLVDGVTGDQLYRCADGAEDVWATDDDEIEVTDVAASSIYC